MKFYIFLLWLLIEALYYGLGGERFPDYLNYITISEKGGYLFYEDEYLAEWLSRLWLSNVGKIVGDHYLSIDVFALVVQISYLIWALSGKKRSDILVKFWITVFMGPLLLTTTLRATIPYILFFQLFLGQLSFVRIAILGVFSISFHDSAIVPFMIVIMAYLLFRESSVLNRRVSQLFFAISLVMVLFGDYLAPVILPFLAAIGLGIRDIYFVNFVPASGYKITYALFVLVIAGLALNNEPNDRLVLIVVGMLCASSILFAISSTPAIRMYLFVFGSSIGLLMRKYRYKKWMSSSLAIYTIPPVILIAMFYDLFRNADV